MNILISLFLLALSTTILHALLGLITIPLQGSLVIDATGHAVISGIACSFLIVKNLHSSTLFFGALLSVFIMHLLTYLLSTTNVLNKDVSLGVAFSFLFALGIFIITVYARNIHLDLDMILAGNIELALYDSIILHNINFGPRMVWINLFLILLIVLGITFFWKPLISLLFDKDHAQTRGYPIFIISTLLISLTSYATVASLSVAGTIILVGISATPVGIWWTDFKNYRSFIVYSLLGVSLLTLLGVIIALCLDLPTAATITVVITSYALIHLLFIQKKSGLAYMQARKRMQIEVLQNILASYGLPEKKLDENLKAHLLQKLRISPSLLEQALRSF